MKLLVYFIGTLLLTWSAGSSATSPDELPDFGGHWGSAISQGDERRIGRMIVHQLRKAGQILEDPEVSEYIQTIGHRLSAQANDGQHEFRFFVVDDPAINAFALPGGFIGVNAGLIQATDNESELAGVLAHEVSHVTQRHIVRTVHAAGQTTLAATAATIAAVLLGLAGGIDDQAVQAAISVAQGYAAQTSINYTRAHEYEADRVGVALLAKANFDPEGMPDFFETLQTHGRSIRVPEFLRTHPLESNRIAETRNRAAQIEDVEVRETELYGLIRARIEVLLAETPEDAVDTLERLADGNILEASDDLRYGYAIALLRDEKPTQARLLFSSLLNEHNEVIAYHSGLAQAQLAAGETDLAMETFERAIGLFPRNVPLTMRYAQALLDVERPEEAHQMLLDLLNNIEYNPVQVRLIAMAASAAGEPDDAHFYMSEFHVLNGELELAIHELEMALATPEIEEIQRARYEARVEDIRKYLPKNKRKRKRKDS